MGDLNVKIDVHSSREFFELSRYINEMLQSLLVNDRKMTYVLGKTDMHIGVYEYNRQMKRVRFTGDILQILKTGTEAAWKLPSDWEDFKKYIRTMQKEPVAGENEIFAVGKGLDGARRISEDEVQMAADIEVRYPDDIFVLLLKVEPADFLCALPFINSEIVSAPPSEIMGRADDEIKGIVFRIRRQFFRQVGL